jgi:hypothetical protein
MGWGEKLGGDPPNRFAAFPPHRADPPVFDETPDTAAPDRVMFVACIGLQEVPDGAVVHSEARLALASASDCDRQQPLAPDSGDTLVLGTP